MIEVTPTQDAYALKATISSLLNALDRQDISTDDRNKLAQTSVSLYAAAQWWDDNVSAVQFEALDRKGEALSPDHPVYFPLRQRMWFILSRIQWTRIFWPGTLLVKQRGPGRRTTALTWLNPNLWRPHVDPFQGLTGFDITGSSRNRIADTRRFIPLRDTIYFHGVDFEDDFGGVAPAEVAYVHAGVEAEVAATWLAIFRNRMMPFGVVQPKDPKKSIPDKEQDEMTAMLRRISSGSHNAGKTIVSNKAWDWVQLGQELNGVPVKAFSDEVNEAVERATGVYRTLISPQDSNFAQAEVARRTWGHSKFLPHINRLGLILTEQLGVEFEDVAEIRPMTRDIKLLKEDAASKAKLINSHVGGMLMDLHTAQVELEREADPLLKGYYVVQGVPVHISRFPQLADRLLAQPTPGVQDGSQLDDQPTIFPSTTEDGGTDVTISRSAPKQLPPPKPHIPDAQFNELKNWRIVAERGKRVFLPDVLKKTDAATFIDEALMTDHAVPDIFAVARQALEKSLDTNAAWEELEAMQSQADYRRSLRSLVRGLWNGALTRFDFVDGVNSAISRRFPEAFMETAKDLGIAEDDIPDTALQWLADQINQELTFVLDFANAIEEGSKANGGKLGPLFVRAEQWASGYERIGQRAKTLLGGKQRYRWTVGATDHCTDCLRLNGRVATGEQFERRLGPLDALPRGTGLACGKGRKCQCDLVPTDEPVTRGRWPVILGPKSHVHITVDSTKGQGKPGLTVIASLTADDLIVDLAGRIQAAKPDTGIQWTDRADYHITLVSAQVVADETKDAIIDRLPDSIEPVSIRITGFDRFEQDTYDVWLLTVESDALRDIQRQVYEAFRAEMGDPAEISGFSDPDDYKPHVTLAYVPKGLSMPETIGDVTGDTHIQEVQFTRADYQVVHELEEA